MGRPFRTVCALAWALALLVVPTSALAHDPEEHDQATGHEPATVGPDLRQNLRLLASSPLADRAANNPNAGSDLAFWGARAYAGNYGGFRIFDISQPSSPRLLSDVRCFGPQNDVSVWNNRILILSVDAPQTTERCGSSRTTTYAQTPDAFEGLRIFDVSNPSEPEFLTAVRTDCGSHTNTVVPDLANDRLLVYVSSYALGAGAIGPDCAAPTAESPVSHDKVSIVEVPLGQPEDAEVINEPSSMFEGGQVCTPSTVNPLVAGDRDFICNPTDDDTRPFASRGCHDIQVLAGARLAACSALAEGQLWDISDPEEPRLLKRVDNPNVEFWHNASFTYDGRIVAFSDEAGGGVEAWCKPGDPDTIGANWFYPVPGDATEPLGHFKPERTTTGNCTAHNGNFLPVRGRYVYTQAWYSLGTSVSDVTDLANPREIAFFQAGDRTPEDATNTSADAWSSYFYRGFVFTNDIHRGFESLFLGDPARRQARRLGHENPQTQERVLFP